MELTEDEIIQKHAKNCLHPNPKTLFPYKYEFTCFSCGYNVTKQKHQLSKTQRQKVNFIKRLKYAEQKILCICVEKNKYYEANDYDKIYEVLSILKTKKLKITNILIEKYKDILENPDFEQDYWSRTAEDIYEIEDDGNRLMKWLVFYDRSYYDNMICFDLMGSIVKSVNYNICLCYCTRV